MILKNQNFVTTIVFSAAKLLRILTRPYVKANCLLKIVLVSEVLKIFLIQKNNKLPDIAAWIGYASVTDIGSGVLIGFPARFY